MTTTRDFVSGAYFILGGFHRRVLRVDFADGNNFRQGWGFRSWRGILYGLIFIIITKWFYGVFVKGKIKNHPPHLLCTPQL